MKDRNPTRRKLGRVCTTICAKTTGEMAKKAATAFAMGTDLVEFRLDLLQEPSLDSVRELAHLA